MIDYILEDWLNEAETAPVAGGTVGAPIPQGMPPAQGSGFTPNNQTMDMTAANNPNSDPNVGNMDSMQGQQDDVTQDPHTPDMPEEKKPFEDFEVWKNQYFKESVKGDTQKLVDMLHEVRDKDGLRSYQRKFVEDNWNIQLLRQNSNIDKASKDVRRNIRDQLDRNNPATSVVNHTVAVLETMPTLNNVFIKLKGYGNLKTDLHRKFIASLICGVQVGSGANTEDIVYNEKEYSILVSTRFNSEWGDVQLGAWSLREDDPDRYLSEPEKKRLSDGSPEEKNVLKRRIILESIAKQYETRAFIINIVGDDGTIYTLGWDLAGSLRAAYTDGKIVVKTKISENSEAMITDEGQIIPFMDLDIFFTKETGQQKEDGMPEVEELNFIEKKNGFLFLKANLKTIREASQSMQGLVLKETPYNGNPSDLQVLSRCTYSTHDLLMRQC